MEALILAAWLHANTPALPPLCPKPFVKAMRDNVAIPASKSPRRPCRYTINGGEILWKGRK